jgi:hypothetical protein
VFDNPKVNFRGGIRNLIRMKGVQYVINGDRVLRSRRNNVDTATKVGWKGAGK